MLYISPEMLMRKKKWRNMVLSELYQKRLVAFIVDEAHCVKKCVFPTAYTSLSGLSCHSHDTIGRSVFETAIAVQQYMRQCRL